jgi:hypothetical protein
MRKVLFAVGVCLLSVASVASAQVEIHSADGRRSVTAFDDGRIMYQSANGVLQVQVTKTGFRVGEVSLEATEITNTATGITMRLVMTNGAKTVSDLIEVNSATGAVTGTRVSQFRKMFRDFARTSDGFLLNEARELIVQNAEDGRARGNAGRITSEWSTYGCGQDLLNSVAAGTAMIGGCAAGGWFCASGVAWYGSSLIQLATGGECVFM